MPNDINDLPAMWLCRRNVKRISHHAPFLSPTPIVTNGATGGSRIGRMHPHTTLTNTCHSVSSELSNRKSTQNVEFSGHYNKRKAYEREHRILLVWASWDAAWPTICSRLSTTSPFGIARRPYGRILRLPEPTALESPESPPNATSS